VAKIFKLHQLFFITQRDRRMIKEKIDAFYDGKNREDSDRTYFYITDTAKCPRAVWFAFKKFPKKRKEARLMRVFEHGDYTHMRIMAALFSMGLVKSIEISIPNQELIHGRADGILSADGVPIVLEIKSINSYAFKQLDSPKKEHIKQIQLYMHYFKIPRGVLIYENKDNQDLKEFELEYNKELSEETLAELELLKKQIDNNVLPEIPGDLEEWQCNYCDYAEECQKRGRIKIIR